MRRHLLIACPLVILLGWLCARGAEYLAARTREVVKAAVREVLDEDARNISRQMNCLARETTAQFVIEQMSKVPALPHKFALLDHALGQVDPGLGGLYCEFGVWKGTTVNHIASRVGTTIHGFDSFEGLPETWRTGFEKGAFRLSDVPHVRENVALHKGWFKDSVPAWAAAHEGPLAFIHFDADLYSSTKTVLDLLADRIVAGTVMQFDEFFNYPGWQTGEFQAFNEFVAEHDIRYEFLGYCRHGEQVAVRILAVGGAGTLDAGPRRAEPPPPFSPDARRDTGH